MAKKVFWVSDQSKIIVDGVKTYDATLKVGTNHPTMSKLRILKNLIALSIGFLLLFSAYLGLANLQSTLNIDENVGLISLSTLYGAMIISSLFLPKLIIRKYGLKSTLVMCSLVCVPYICANFYPRIYTLVPASFLSGLVGPLLWSAQSTYLNEISVLYASLTSESAEIVTARFFGVFFMACQSTQLWGNMASFFILRPDTEKSYFNETVACGAEYCFELNDNLKSPSDEKKNMLIGIYLVSGCLAIFIIAVFLDTIQRKNEDDNESLASRIFATLNQIKKPKQILLLPLTVFSGLQQGFFVGDFTKAYIACAWGIYHVGLVFMFIGVVDAFTAFTAGRLVKYIPRVVIMLIGTAGNIAVSIVLLLWHPNNGEYIMFFILAGIWGVSDGTLQTMLNTFYGVLFRSEEEAAYSTYRLWESVGFIIAFVSSNFLCVAPKIYIALTVLIIGMICYITTEVIVFHQSTKSKQYIDTVL
ncbi:UNC93-like protein [Parasteatoda tepidariorum]|uniref:UNC93-like protein n=1 Tax=Parasteatoda tepidariorum TaxID=114398 RepID=UPI001C72416F|nr:UNC93-like protein [Parasteatoda tepidariorum]